MKNSLVVLQAFLQNQASADPGKVQQCRNDGTDGGNEGGSPRTPTELSSQIVPIDDCELGWTKVNRKNKKKKK